MAIGGGAYYMARRRGAAQERKVAEQERLEGRRKPHEEGVLTPEELAAQKDRAC
jgi:hypothetical protein